MSWILSAPVCPPLSKYFAYCLTQEKYLDSLKVCNLKIPYKNLTNSAIFY
jgi:hypothetical protein